MSHFAGIPVCIEPDRHGETIGGGVQALLYEIAALAERLAEEGDAGAIDLKSLPMSAADYRQLRDALGQGEVTIELCINGRTRLIETSVAGVWWTEHRDQQDGLVAEFIEVATIPKIVPATSQEIRKGAAELRRRLCSNSEEGGIHDQAT